MRNFPPVDDLSINSLLHFVMCPLFEDRIIQTKTRNHGQVSIHVIEIIHLRSRSAEGYCNHRRLYVYLSGCLIVNKLAAEQLPYHNYTPILTILYHNVCLRHKQCSDGSNN